MPRKPKTSVTKTPTQETKSTKTQTTGTQTTEAPATSSHKILLTTLSIIFLLGVGFIYNQNLYKQKNNQSQNELAQKTKINSQEKLAPPQEQNNSTSNEDLLTPRPDLWMSVPFTPQAPTANWDELHNEACEEASAIMAASYLSQDSENGKTVKINPIIKPNDNLPDKYFALLDPTFVESEITKLTKWEDKNFGYNLSIDSYETAQMLREVYNVNAKVVPYSFKEIQKLYLSGENIVILPTNGQLLKNPHYKAPGPIYHMLVVTGYNPTQLITNDSGTKKGYNYIYEESVVQKAVGNWDHKTDKVDLSKKLMIVISRK